MSTVVSSTENCPETDSAAETLGPVPSAGGTGRTLKTRLRSAWNWLRAAAAWVPLTARAVLAIPVLILTLQVYGLGRDDQILLAVAVSGLALVGVSVLLVLTLALWFRLRRQAVPEGPLALEAGVPCRTGHVLGRLDWLPLLKFELAWEQPGGIKVQLVPGPGGLHEEVTAAERGLAEGIVRTITITDVFGLARFVIRRPALQPITIKPHSGQVRALTLVRQNVTGDQLGHPEGKPGGDLIEMRPYAPGDPLKLVLWKVYARTGRMLVRMPERAVSPSERTLAYLVAGEGDEPAAGIARAVLESGALGTAYLFRAEGAETPTRAAGEAVEQVIRSAGARAHGGSGLASFLGQGENQGIQACILFVPARTGAWLGRVEEQLARSRGPFRVVLGIDGLRPEPEGRWLKRLLLRRESADGSTPAEVRQVAKRLQQAGAEVTVLDRLTGQSVPLADLPESHPTTNP